MSEGAGVSATFIGPPGQRLFVVLHGPSGTPRGCVLLVPPFAEEMNKTRRMLTLVAQSVAARGFLAVLPDLFGTGDSDGEFADASWRRWQEDLRSTWSFLGRTGRSITSVLAVRTGCALVAEVARADRWRLTKSVFWQPVVDGQRFFTQFLRLRVATALMESDRRESVKELRARLSAGETLEVAGYGVSRDLAEELERMTLRESLGENLGDLHWIEISRSDEQEISKDADRAIEEGHGMKKAIECSTIRGEPFWSSTEIVEIPPLVERTVDILVAR